MRNGSDINSLQSFMEQKQKYKGRMLKTVNFVVDREIATFYDPGTFAPCDSDHPGDNSRHKLIKQQRRAIPSNTDDLKIVHNLNRLDQLTMKFGDPDRHDELLWDVQQGIMKRLDIWLALRGINSSRCSIVRFSEIYLTFIYGIKHERPVTLKNALGPTLYAFMFHHLFRDDYVNDSERTLCPSAIRMLYLFLHEKCYMSDSDQNMLALIDKIEPCFLHLLRETN